MAFVAKIGGMSTLVSLPQGYKLSSGDSISVTKTEIECPAKLRSSWNQSPVVITVEVLRLRSAVQNSFCLNLHPLQNLLGLATLETLTHRFSKL
jgi:hypothetical protein